MDGAREALDIFSFARIFIKRLSRNFHGAMHGRDLFDQTEKARTNFFQRADEIIGQRTFGNDFAFRVIRAGALSEMDGAFIRFRLGRKILKKSRCGADGDDEQTAAERIERSSVADTFGAQLATDGVDDIVRSDAEWLIDQQDAK